jgi:hypothetical protein
MLEGSLDDGTSCKQGWQCPDGEYVTFCSVDVQPAGYSECGCYKPMGQMTSQRMVTQVNACLVAAQLCNQLSP